MLQKKRKYLIEGIKKIGTLVAPEIARARILVCKTKNNNKPCEHYGQVNPIDDWKEEGCTKCGCPFATKAFMKTAFLNKVTCPHEDGNFWNNLNKFLDMSLLDEKSILDYGHAIANPLAIYNDSALWQPRDKNYVGKNPSEDFYEVATTGNLTAFQFNGTTYTLATPLAAATDAAAIQKAIEDEVCKFEKFVWVRVSYASGKLTIRHIGDLRLSQVSIDDVGGGAAQATSNLATVVNIADFVCNELQGQIGPLTFDGQSFTLPNETYSYTGTPATDAATATQLATDITAALVSFSITVIGTVSVTVNTATLSFDVAFTAYKQDAAIYASGADQTILEGNNRMIFVA